MLRTATLPQRYFSLPDLIVLALIGTSIYAVVTLSNQWQSDFNPVTHLDLSSSSLLYYTFLSGIRGSVAYLVSLLFTLVVGYVAAKSKQAERIIIPMLDILQSIPVLGFLPGLSLGLIALFPHTNTGLELTAITTIFLGQVWNMTFSFYSSLKSVPSDFNEASNVIGLGRWQRLMTLELPFSAVNLAWNSLMSMAGGWFFLTVCEAFTLGDREFRLPGVGAYMDLAIHEGNTRAMLMGVGAMIALIVSMDFLIWRPILAWVQKFRIEEVQGVAGDEPLMRVVIRESRIVRFFKLSIRRYRFSHRMERPEDVSVVELPRPLRELQAFQNARRSISRIRQSRVFGRIVEYLLGTLVVALICWGTWRLLDVLVQVKLSTWIMILRNAFWSFLRVMIALLLGTLWAVPAGIWIGTSARRIRIAQPIIQVMASFPAPMLYPLALGLFFALGINFDWSSVFLLLLGAQWYILFNVLAGALRIPRELLYALSLMESSRWDYWRTLYLPSVFPALVTGWVTAAGGAWNASIVAEVIAYKGATYRSNGLGSMITEAVTTGNFPLLAASLTVMVVVVLFLNRAVWSRVYHLAQTRFRMDA